MHRLIDSSEITSFIMVTVSVLIISLILFILGIVKG